MSVDLDYVWFKGRLMLDSVKWWLENSDMDVSTLYCKHKVSLTEECWSCSLKTTLSD